MISFLIQHDEKHAEFQKYTDVRSCPFYRIDCVTEFMHV